MSRPSIRSGQWSQTTNLVASHHERNSLSITLHEIKFERRSRYTLAGRAKKF